MADDVALEMTGPGVVLRRFGGTTALWAGGVAALLGMVVYSHATATPYPTTWPWITFAAMAILEEALLAPAGDATRLTTRVVLVAAIIMFRKHPDVTAIVTLAAGLAGGFLARLPSRTVLTRTAWLLLLALAGTACLRLVGYGDTPHFVAATGALIVVYVAGTVAIDGSRPQLLKALAASVLGALFALAWRTPASGPLMLRLGEVAILALIGVAIGVAMGGRPQGVLNRRVRLQAFPVIALFGGIGLLLSTRLTGQAAALLAAASLGMIGLFALLHRWFPVACMLLGGLGNEVARLANGGRMPVDTIALPGGVADELGDLGQTSTYQAANSGTHLAWLADRFPLSPFPGVASAGDIVIAMGIVWIFAALTAPRQPQPQADSVVSSKAA